jgi:hypothetical protein
MPHQESPRIGQFARKRVLFHALVVVGLVFAGYLFFVAAPFKGSMAFDVVAYWSVDLAAPYHGNVGDLGFFPYSPAAALVLAPFTALPWLAFACLWYAALIAALTFMGRRSFLVLLAFPPVAIDLYHGNIHLLLAAAIVVGFRYPQAWAFVLLTKVTPGFGLLWFVARREWRSLALALGATAAIAAATAVLLPRQWLDWIAMLASSASVPPPWPALPIPLIPRLLAAAAIVWWGARRDFRWTVPLAAAMSVPALWPGAFAILAACWPLRRRTDVIETAETAAAPAASPDYHAADASDRRRAPAKRSKREPAGDPRPSTA